VSLLRLEHEAKDSKLLKTLPIQPAGAGYKKLGTAYAYFCNF
jgi:hypothetical protein